MTTAAQRSLLNCHACGKLSREPRQRAHALACPRCGAPLHRRKPNSIRRTWALVITAVIFYLPANLYPIMTIRMMGEGEPHTILGGVVALLEAKSYPSAILVLFASIMVPLVKLLGLSFLLLSVQLRWHWRPRDRTLAYRIIEMIGRWSMIDVFMVSILVALVNLGALAVVEPGLGAVFFCSVVIVTMFAAASFDPRLIWDSLEDGDDRRPS